MEETYKIVRLYEDGRKRVMRRGLTLEEAQKHCKDPATSSISGTGKPTRKGVRWFDGYTKE